MKVKYSKKFLKQLAKLPSQYKKIADKIVFYDLPKCTHIAELRKVEKMQGYKSFFKIRIGLYRIGIKIIDNSVEVRCLFHRKDIYRFFP